MSRYIDAEKLKESVEGLQDCYNGFSDTYDKSCIIGLIDEEPTADVISVVRCYECKHSCRLDGTKILYQCDHNGVRPNYWFCADGEKVMRETVEWVVELGNSYPKFKKMLVRCKDCKYGEIDNPDFPDRYLCHFSGCDWNNGEHFCADGEKVTENG